MRCHKRFVFLAILTVTCACSGGGRTTTTTTIPQVNAAVNAPAGNVRSVQLGLQPISATLPVVSQITGTLRFPAVGTPMAISLGCSAMAPAGAALESMRRAQSGTLTVYEYCTIVSPITTSLPSLPAMTLHFPASTPLAGKAFFYGISDLNAQGGLVSFNTQGPGTIAGQTVSFAQVPTAITYEAGHRYTSVVYATGTAVKVGATKIYVTAYSSRSLGTVTTYNADGTPTTPTITAGLNNPSAIAVDAAGKIYVANSGNSTVTTYKADGTQTTPTITSYDYGGPSIPCCIAVDATGKIDVLSLSPSTGSGPTWILRTYKPDGSLLGLGLSGKKPSSVGDMYGNSFSGIAVDAAGKIYVANYANYAGLPDSGTVTTYNPDGTFTPTITIGLHSPDGIAVDAAGKIIHVANTGDSTVTTYRADGTPIAPTITASDPVGVAVDAAGKIYVLNAAGAKNIVTTYNPDGSASTPTISARLSNPTGIAVH